MEHNMKIIEKEFNILTGVEFFIEREETKEETKKRLEKEKALQAYAEAQAKAEADKAAILVRLGLTEEELQTILG